MMRCFKTLHQQVLTNFAQQHMEPFYAAWERFKDMMARCPNHNFPKWYLLQIFYQGLSFEAKNGVDDGAIEADGNSLFSRTIDEVYYLLEDLAAFNYQWYWNSSMQNQSWEGHSNLTWSSHSNMMEQSVCQQQIEKTPLEIALAQLQATAEEFSRSMAEMNLKSMESSRNLEEQMKLLMSTTMESCLENEESNSNCAEPEWEFEPQDEKKLQDEGHVSFDVVLAQSVAELDSQVIEIESYMLNQEMSIQIHELYEEQTASMVMDSQGEREKQLERSLEELPFEEKAQNSLEDEEVYETIDLSSSLVLPYIPPIDPYLPLILPSPYYTLHKLEPKEKFHSQAHHSKPCHVGPMSQVFPYPVKLEDILNHNPYVVLYDTFYGRKPLFDDLFSKSLANDYNLSAYWEATQVS